MPPNSDGFTSNKRNKFLFANTQEDRGIQYQCSTSRRDPTKSRFSVSAQNHWNKERLVGRGQAGPGHGGGGTVPLVQNRAGGGGGGPGANMNGQRKPGLSEMHSINHYMGVGALLMTVSHVLFLLVPRNGHWGRGDVFTLGHVPPPRGSRGIIFRAQSLTGSS